VSRFLEEGNGALAGATAAVVCPEALAADAGRTALAAGGNAIDAMIAAAFAQGVTAPFMTSIGGSAKIHYYDALTRRSTVINAAVEIGSRPAPAEWAAGVVAKAETAGRFVLPNWENSVGYWSIMTPGFVRGCWTAFQRYGSGRLRWQDLLKPAIQLSHEGFPIDAYLAGCWSTGTEPAGAPPLMTTLRATEPATRQFLKPDGSFYVEGDLFVQGDLAQTLQRIADFGGDDFYVGAIGEKISADLGAHGCTVTREDLRSYEVHEVPPIEGRYRGFNLRTMPPPSAGPVVLEMLGILEHFDLRALGHNSPEFIDTFARVQRVGFANSLHHTRGRSEGAGDRSDHVARWAKQIMNGHRAEVRNGAVLEDGTTHVTVIDSEQSIACMTHSIGTAAGSGVVTSGLGFPYNNFLGHYDPRGGRVNSISPGQRLGGGPPTIVFDGDRPIIGIGAPGGSRLITSIVQVLVNALDFGMEMPAAVKAPRFHSEEGQLVFLEPAFEDEVAAALVAKGNEIRRSTYMSRVQAVRVRRDGTIDAGPDPRGGAVRFFP
jgi:gamma-glutamyltranspeptidase/glutathione hydrolase